MKPIEELLRCYVDGEATDEDLRELDDWLRADVDHRRQFVRATLLNRQLRDALLGQHTASPGAAAPSADAADDALPVIEVKQASLLHRPNRYDSLHWQRHKIRFNTFSAVLTALAWIGFSYFVWLTTTPDNSRPERDGVNVNFVARITGQYEHQWVASTRGIPPFAFLVPGEELNLVEGLIEITFFDGAVVVLEGPSDFVVNSPGAGTLEVGKLAARVPEEATGFVIDTPSARFVDLGTEFGVEVDVQGLSELHVTKGTVEATLISNRGHRITVSQGQAVRLDEERVGFARIPVNTGRFVTVVPLLLRVPSRSANPNLVTPVGVTSATSGPQNSFSPQYLIDNSGLDAPYDETAIHSIYSPTTSWYTITNPQDGNVALTFDLGGDYSLTGVVIWAYNETMTAREITVEFSATGLDGEFSDPVDIVAPSLRDVPHILSLGDSFDANAVRLTINSSYRSPLDGHFGLAEVKFLANVEPEQEATEATEGT